MTIIRHAPGISGVKRLGEPRSGDVAAVTAAPAPCPEDVRAVLREQFAEELEALRDEARHQGRQAAEADLKAAVQQYQTKFEKQMASDQERRDGEQKAAIAALAQLADALHQEIASLRQAAEAAALEIAYQVVIKLLGRAVTERELLGALVGQALREHRLSGPVTVQLAPIDAARLQGTTVDGIEAVFVPDAALAPGDCRISFGEGRLDASLAKQLTHLRDLFLESLDDRHADA